ncbi:hypothetical protein CIHG_01798 [Coccidioides immitis H538.4]|uniref:Uncharacterized protein n=2 Tax=Coccidioides immitis TaxID=5501 RepID=A0A0J8R7C1_COCIT|nr:hypothetical protein CISG_02201 [Coccidioides immitis RMSCC 3703]KMU84014.1 hypothetical protein CIHG_01798 [Coccidioides immitis H538.4]
MWRLSKALDAWKLVDRLRTSRRGIYPRQYPGRFASSVQQLLHVSRGYSPSTNSRMRSVSMRRMFSDDHAFRRSGLATDLQAWWTEYTPSLGLRASPKEKHREDRPPHLPESNCPGMIPPRMVRIAQRISLSIVWSTAI